MNYEVILQAIDAYEAKNIEEIRKEMMEIIDSWKDFNLALLAKKANVKPATLYQIKKRCVKYRPSFETYVRIKAIGKNIYAE